MIKVYSYEEMPQSGLPLDILAEMRHFGYARYDVFDGFDCVSLEMLNYDDLLLSRGSILLYMESVPDNRPVHIFSPAISARFGGRKSICKDLHPNGNSNTHHFHTHRVPIHRA